MGVNWISHCAQLEFFLLEENDSNIRTIQFLRVNGIITFCPTIEASYRHPLPVVCTSKNSHSERIQRLIEPLA